MWERPRVYPSGATFSFSLLGKLSALLENIRVGWKSLPRPNTRLLQKLINYDHKKFHNIGPWPFDNLSLQGDHSITNLMNDPRNSLGAGTSCIPKKMIITVSSQELTEKQDLKWETKSPVIINLGFLLIYWNIVNV